ncbi:MAG: PAS domain S-box protein [Deltaproteobacteria bacterium]|nr:PAS domain S-box protein [Deltaproteobacteria bacterium]
MKTPLSLRRYLSLQLSLVIIVQSVIVTVLVWQILLPQMRTDIGIRHQALARAIAGQVAAHMLGGERQLSALADYIEARANLPATHWIELLDTQCGNGDLFETIYISGYRDEVIDCVGLAGMRRGSRNDLMGLDLSGRNFIRSAISLKKVFWSETFLSTASSRMAVAVTIPLSDRAIVGEITVDQLSALISKLPVESGLVTMILDRRGRIVADSQGVLGGQQLNEKKILTSRDDGNVPFSSDSFELDGKPLIGTVVPIDRLGWKVLVAQFHQNAYQSLRVTFMTILLGLVISILLALGAAWFQANKLSHFFHIYSERARSIARGNYELKLPVAKTMEFVQLSDSLQQMAHMIRQRERQIVENENNLKITLNSIGDAVIATDVDSAITRMNPSAEQLTGWSFTEAEGKHLSEVFRIVNGHTREKVRSPVERVLDEGEVVGLANHTILIAKNGNEYQIADSGAPIRQSDGRIIGVVMVFRDVTDIYAQEQKIRESENLFKNLTANVPGVVYQVNVSPDRSCSVNFVSEQMTDIFGLDVPSDKYITEFIAHVPEDEKIPLQASITESIENVSAWHWEGRYNKPSGENIWFSGSAIPHKNGDDVVFYGVLTDVTERKRTEEALRKSQTFLEAIFEHSPYSMWVSDDKSTLIRMNQACRDMLCVTDEDLIGKYNIFEDIIVEQQGAMPLVKRVFENGERVQFNLNYDISRLQTPRRSESTLLFLEVTISPILNTRKQVIHAIIQHHDITERKRAEEEKDRLQAQFNQAQKMDSVGRLAGGVAHDFNNMLTAILGQAELAMMRCTPSEPIHAALKAIKQAALRSSELIRQLLAFARKQTVAPEVLDLNSNVAGMVGILKRLIGEDIDFAWRPGMDLWPVKIDPSQIDQLLTNLCVNARDAISGVGKITIETANAVFDEAYCAVHQGFVPGEYAMLAVSDDGQGMDKEILDHIFEPFFTTKGIGKGTGLGLATVYGIVKQNDGFINVYSESGKGASFKIYLPRFAGEAFALTAISAATEIPTSRGETVLLVEDEPLILEVGLEMLETLGYKVLTAGTPAEAIEQVRTHAGEIQLLFTDVIMPEMNGQDLAKLLRGIKPGLKCLFASGYTANVIAHRGVLDEDVNFIQKPFSLQNMAAKVREALDRK